MATTNTKTTTKKPSTRKAKVEEPVVETVETPVQEPVQEPVKESVKNIAKTYERDDLITCRSVTAGYLGFSGPRTKQLYPFENMGDVGYIEYQDLNSLLASRSKILFEPYIVIEDEKLLEDVRWADLRAVYASMFNLEDAKQIINLPVNEFRVKFPKLPLGLKNAVKAEVSKQIEEGRFDSIQKVKVIDEICDTSIGSIMLN